MAQSDESKTLKQLTEQMGKDKKEHIKNLEKLGKSREEIDAAMKSMAVSHRMHLKAERADAYKQRKEALVKELQDKKNISEVNAKREVDAQLDLEKQIDAKRNKRDKTFLGRMLNTVTPKSSAEKDMEAKKTAEEQTGLLRSLAKGIGGGAMKGGMGLMGLLEKVIGGKLKLILMGIAGGLMVLFSQLKLSQVKKMWEGFKDAIMAIWDFLAPIYKALWEWTKSVALPALVDAFMTQVGLIGELFSKLKERFSGFMEMSWSERIMAIFGAFGDIASYIGDTIKNLLVTAEKMLGGDGTFVTDLWDKIGGFFTGLMDWFKLLWENPGEALSKAWTGLLEGAASIGGWLMDNAITPAWEWLKGAWSGMTEAISAKWTEWFPDGIGTWLVDKVWKPFKEWFRTLFDFSSIRSTIESLINIAYIVPNIIKKYLLDPAVKWIGDKFGFDTSSFTDFNIGQLAMKGWDSLVGWFKETFDLKMPEMPDWDIGSKIKDMVKGMISGFPEWLVPDKILKWANAKPKPKPKPPVDIPSTDIVETGKLQRQISQQPIVRPMGQKSALQKQLQRDEGFRESVYKDTMGIKTVGYGFNLEKAGAQKSLEEQGINKSVEDLKSGKATLTEEEAAKLMMGEMPYYRSVAEKFVGTSTWKKLPGGKKDAITNLAYNLGAGTLNKFNKLRSAIQKGDWERASNEILYDSSGGTSKYASQVKGRATRIASALNPNDKIGAMNDGVKGMQGTGGGKGQTIVVADASTKSTNTNQQNMNYNPDGSTRNGKTSSVERG